jgi:hypothetical protein
MRIGYWWESQKEREYKDQNVKRKGKAKAVPVTGREGP